jgi:hypothetical protein
MSHPTKTLTERLDQNSLLHEWRGASAEVWMFHLSLRRLAILLRLPERSVALYVVAVGCKHMNGPFRWSDAKLSVADLDQSGGEGHTRVNDENAHFELICDGGVTLCQYPQIVHSFEDFKFPQEGC